MNASLVQTAKRFPIIVAKTSKRVMPVVLFYFLASLVGKAQSLPAGWTGAAVGTGGGSASYATGTYTVTGSGAGLNPVSSDAMYYTYYSLTGNCRLTVRVASFNGAAGSQVGLALRAGTTATALTGGFAYEPLAGTGTVNPNRFELLVRNSSNSYYPIHTIPNNSQMATPCYLQIVRYGNTFAVYKSTDGIFWAQITDESGGAFSTSGPIDVGFYVSSGGSSTVTATFDSVNLETAPTLPYESSWIGNTGATDETEYTSSTVTSMWVGPDGTCYTAGNWDEGGEYGKVYKNGAVVNGFTLNCETHEGGITSDGSYLYYWGAPSAVDHQLFQVNMSGTLAGGYKPIYTQSPITNPTSGINEIAGLACANGMLYASDEYTQSVLVLNPYASPPYGTSLSVNQASVTGSIDTSLISSPVPPQAVYQTAFEGNPISMTIPIPGFTLGTDYTVRLHFAELNPNDDAAGKRVMDLTVGSQTDGAFDIYATAGAINKAVAVVFSNVKPNSSGNITVSVARDAKSVDGSAILNGIEILNAAGTTPITQINCGGGPVGSWVTTVNEASNFPFTRPGPIAADKDGNLWIVQEGTTFPAAYNFTYTPGWAAIKLYSGTGSYLGKEITDVVNPTAVSYNSNADQLYVAENGPAQNIRIYNVYTGSSTQPAVTGTLGIAGGVFFPGSTSGLVYDSANGGYARFFGPVGVGTDSTGNVYVACNPGENQSDVRSFTGNSLNWKVEAREMTTVGDFDPSVHAGDVWTTTHHYSMDWSNTTPGTEWSLKSFITNPFNTNGYTFPSNLGAGNSVYRKPNGVPILFTAGQGLVGTIYIYRFSGEQAIPAGSITGTKTSSASALAFWTDTNGNGKPDADETSTITTPSNAGVQGFSVDNAANIYLAMGGTGATGPNVTKFAFTGINQNTGVPTWSSSITHVNCPPPFNTQWGNGARCVYVGDENDTMYLLGPTSPGAPDENYGGTLACYNHWSTSPVQVFSTVLPTPATNANFLNGAPPYTDGNGFFYIAFDVSNYYSFCTDLWGTIHVVAPGGNLVTNIIPGPELNGGNDWEDEAMGIRTSYNSTTAEYDILQESSGFRGRQSFYRMKGLGPFFASLDIGAVGAPGSASGANGTYTVNGDGADIGGTADACQFYNQYLSLDSTIIAQVTSLTDPGGQQLAKAGVMMRDSATWPSAGAIEASMLLTPNQTAGEGALFEFRSATSGTTTTVAAPTAIALPYWVKLVRAGYTFAGYISPDGKTWTQVGTTQTLSSMAAQQYTGLTVTSHTTIAPCATGQFSNVTVTMP